MKSQLYEHFTLPRYCNFLHNVSITLINKLTQVVALKAKIFWINTLKTKAFVGLNFHSHDSI